MSGCNNEKAKLLIETNNNAEKTKKINKPFVDKNKLKTKILERTALENNTINKEKKTIMI